MEWLALELEMQSILEGQKRQNGFLSLSDRLRLRSAQSRSNDLSTAASVDSLVHPNTKDPKLMGPDQEEEYQSDVDGAQTPTRLAEVSELLRDFASETTSTSGKTTPTSALSFESEPYESYAAALKR
ncbi:hypothetical protein FAGAP_8213 [Fusarium agapanthi]|uniref:Uncharacterized protein n=1 Tax=Fusarium agapanthi TaxID=1803897 RepID=A0A9P5B5A0_9HYPO|nr:hypothetical protein FAGAP_8213 [Fusarium agapanthi]